MSRAPENIRRGRLTNHEEERIIDLAERGLNSGQVALKLNRHPSTVHFAFVRLGLHRRPMRVRPDYVRAGRPVIAFGPEEDAFITALRVQSYSLRQIADLAAKRFGHARTQGTMGIRLKMLAMSGDEA